MAVIRISFNVEEQVVGYFQFVHTDLYTHHLACHRLDDFREHKAVRSGY